MSNTQARIFDLNDAIDRDRAARKAEDKPVQLSITEEIEQDESHPWELWLAIGVGLMVIMIATIL